MDKEVMDLSPEQLKDRQKVLDFQSSNRRLFDQIIETGLAKGAQAKELERIAQGGVDYSLFNLMLQRVDFKDCHSMIEAMRKMYESLWPFYAKTILENSFFRSVWEKTKEGGVMSQVELEKMEEICNTEVDPNGVARRTLEEIRDLAKRRRKLGLY